MSEHAEPLNSSPETASTTGERATPELSADSAARPADFQLWRVVAVIAPFVLISAGVIWFFGFFDGVGWIEDLRKPPLVQVSGTVLFNGEPLPGGQVETDPLLPGLMGARGNIDAQGRFTLKTDVKGTYLEGAYACEHKVKVTRRNSNFRGFGAPPLLTPAVYSEYDSSPLRIVIERPPGTNDLKLILETEDAKPTATPEKEPSADLKEGQ